MCQDETGPSNDCDPDSEPHDAEQCNAYPCPNWRVGAWGKVSLCSSTHRTLAIYNPVVCVCVCVCGNMKFPNLFLS